MISFRNMSRRKQNLIAIVAPLIVIGAFFGKDYLDSKVRERADANHDGKIDKTEMRQLYRDIGLNEPYKESLNFPGLSGFQALRYLNR